MRKTSFQTKKNKNSSKISKVGMETKSAKSSTRRGSSLASSGKGKKRHFVSKITSKYQATIPKEIREKLRLGQGDSVGFDIEDGKVVIRKISPLDVAYLRAVQETLTEWLSDEDEELFRDL